MTLKREPVRSPAGWAVQSCSHPRRIMRLRLRKSILNPVHAIFKKPLMMTTLLLILKGFLPIPFLSYLFPDPFSPALLASPPGRFAFPSVPRQLLPKIPVPSP